MTATWRIEFVMDGGVAWIHAAIMRVPHKVQALAGDTAREVQRVLYAPQHALLHYSSASNIRHAKSSGAYTAQPPHRRYIYISII